MNITPDKELHLRTLYENAKYNRLTSKERAEQGSVIDQHYKCTEYFWGGNINALHSICDALGYKFDWMSSRTEDFNEYYKQSK